VRHSAELVPAGFCRHGLYETFYGSKPAIVGEFWWHSVEKFC